jgi:hypothetical protein
LALGCSPAQTSSAARPPDNYWKPANDEIVIYHFSTPPDKSDPVTLHADKVVNGKPEEMYVIDLTYDKEKNTLQYVFARGTWRYTFHGNKTEGGL